MGIAFVLENKVSIPNLPYEQPPGISRFSWVSPDGIEWDLLRGSVRVLEQGVEGLHEPPISHAMTQMPQGHGGVWSGWRAPPRSCFWRVLVEESSRGQYAVAAKAFFDSFEYDRLGTWIVDDGYQERTLRCRLDSAEHRYERDPVAQRLAIVGVPLIADDPWWRGASRVVSWEAGDSENWLPRTDRHSFLIGSSREIGSAQITNDGDVPLSPVWTVEGPSSSVRIEVEGSAIQGDIGLEAGESVVIDPSANGGATKNDGTDITHLFDVWGATRVPPRATVDAVLESAGGTISATITPQFRRGVA